MYRVIIGLIILSGGPDKSSKSPAPAAAAPAPAPAAPAPAIVQIPFVQQVPLRNPAIDGDFYNEEYDTATKIYEAGSTTIKIFHEAERYFSQRTETIITKNFIIIEPGTKTGRAMIITSLQVDNNGKMKIVETKSIPESLIIQHKP